MLNFYLNFLPVFELASDSMVYYISCSQFVKRVILHQNNI